MKPGYDLKTLQTQKLAMTPEMKQAIQILQFNAHELEAYIQEQLMENPCLEPDEEQPAESQAEEKNEIDAERRETAAAPAYDYISCGRGAQSSEEGRTTREIPMRSEQTLHQSLISQLGYASTSKRLYKICLFIIGSLDDNGYITMSDADIARILNVTEREVADAAALIRSFEPAGVGARSLSDCLLIQLRRLGVVDKNAERLISDFLPELAENRLTVVAREMDMTPAEIQETADFIKTLEPKPGRQFASQEALKYIVPDVIIEKIGDEYVVIVNDRGIPKIRISGYYSSLLSDSGEDEELQKYLSGKISSAEWLMRSIEQRKNTISDVATALLNIQYDFFEKGTKYLKPMTLKNVAESIGMHESTVSRAVNGKYLQCARGLFEMKYFFANEIEGGISSESVRGAIREIIEGESPGSPYSDQFLTEALKERGINISRRTVAKYRDEMGIPSSPKRKRY